MLNEEQKKQIAWMQTVLKEEYRPRYHFTAPCGFINDPNGFSYANGKYNLFYQYRAANIVGWGHAESTDLAHFTHLPVAIMPSQSCDRDGCWSGGAVEREGKLYLLYTGQNNATPTAPQYETQCLAISSDGISFQKYENNPVIRPEQLDSAASHADFRDPCVWQEGEYYYAVVGNAREKDWQGRAQLFRSKTLTEWEYLGIAYEDEAFGGMWECPSFTKLSEEKDLLVFSPMSVPVAGADYHNARSSVYVIGKIDYEAGKFIPESSGEIDHGKDFYAPQLTRGKDGKPVMIAWMANWDREYYLNVPNVGFENCFTMPRELSAEGGKLVQKPLREVLSAFRLEKTQTYKVAGKIELPALGNVLRLRLSVDMKNARSFTVGLLVGEGAETRLSYDKTSMRLTLDSSRSHYPTKGERRERVHEGIRYAQLTARDTLELDVFLDVSCVEVFAGKDAVLSQISINKPTAKNAYFAADGEAVVTAEIFKYE